MSEREPKAGETREEEYRFIGQPIPFNARAKPIAPELNKLPPEHFHQIPGYESDGAE